MLAISRQLAQEANQRETPPIAAQASFYSSFQASSSPLTLTQGRSQRIELLMLLWILLQLPEEALPTAGITGAPPFPPLAHKGESCNEPSAVTEDGVGGSYLPFQRFHFLLCTPYSLAITRT